jgi:hypothetical protein
VPTVALSIAIAVGEPPITGPLFNSSAITVGALLGYDLGSTTTPTRRHSGQRRVGYPLLSVLTVLLLASSLEKKLTVSWVWTKTWASLQVVSSRSFKYPSMTPWSCITCMSLSRRAQFLVTTAGELDGIVLPSLVSLNSLASRHLDLSMSLVEAVFLGPVLPTFHGSCGLSTDRILHFIILGVTLSRHMANGRQLGTPMPQSIQANML